MRRAHDRTQPFAAVGTAFLLVLLSACSGDGTGPGDDDEPGIIFDRLVIDIAHIGVIHDCDPAWDNPGDFQGWVDIYQAMNPVQGEVNFQLLGSSPRRTLLLNSGESVSGTDIRAEG
ncbi:MAG: hypothetical protein KFH98_03970, partial [Gemmatimonadetes bacterium]|nr:hypothetical protein [Gemmatimonadota bacterium]